MLDRVLEEDGVTGDAYGPYDPDFVEDERERLAEEEVRFSTFLDGSLHLVPSTKRRL